MAARSRPKIYLAGPEVFLPNAREIGEAKVALARAAGFEAVFPLDPSLEIAHLAKPEQARRIYDADVGLMNACDLAILNMTPFRGVSMDAGTAFEAGYMRAQGKPVFGYSNVAADLKARSLAWRQAAPALVDADRPDVVIEDFGLAENLMIAVAVRQSGGTVVSRRVARGAEMTDLEGFKACLAEARTVLRVGA